MPVIQPCPFEVLIIQREAVWPYQMQPGPCYSTGSGDVAGIGMDAWFYQYNIKLGHGFIRFFLSALDYVTGVTFFIII